MLWSGKTTDVLPVDRVQLEGIARLMEYPPGSASRLEDDYLGVTRRARQELQLLGDVEVHALRLPHMDRRYSKG